MSKPIKNNSQMLYLQARQLFERAKQKFEDNSIQSEPKLIASVFNSFQEFFTSVGNQIWYLVLLQKVALLGVKILIK